jgi:hypothetical protein
MLLDLFALVILETGVGGGCSLFAQAALDCNPPIYAPYSSWDDRHAPPHPAFSVQMGSHTLLPQLT